MQGQTDRTKWRKSLFEEDTQGGVHTWESVILLGVANGGEENDGVIRSLTDK